MSSREDTPEPGTSAASAGQAAPQDDEREDNAAAGAATCPECRDASPECSSSCRHCFCQLCLWDWSLSEATCPRCQRPTRHPYPQHVALYHEVQERVYDRKRRWRGHSARPWERRPRRSVRWPRDGRRSSRHGRGSDSPRRRWWQQQRRAWEDTPEEGQTPRVDWAVAASSQGWRSRRRSQRSWSQQERSRGRPRWSRGRERSHGWDRSRREQDTPTGSLEHAGRRRRWRSWNIDDRRTPGPQNNVSSESSQTHPSEDSDSSGQGHTRSRQSRGRSHRRGQNSQAGSQRTVPHDHSTNQRRWRSWNADHTHTPRPQHDTPSRRRERHQREDWDSSRHPTRSQTQGRSHRRSHNSQRASQARAPRNHSTNQRQWRSWNNDQERAPRSQQDTPGSSGRRRPRRRNWSCAGRRDT